MPKNMRRPKHEAGQCQWECPYLEVGKAMGAGKHRCMIKLHVLHGEPVDVGMVLMLMPHDCMKIYKRIQCEIIKPAGILKLPERSNNGTNNKRIKERKKSYRYS